MALTSYCGELTSRCGRTDPVLIQSKYTVDYLQFIDYSSRLVNTISCLLTIMFACDFHTISLT